jgi:hypothetical protein
VSPFTEDELQRLGAIASDLDPVAKIRLLERAQGEFEVLRVVLDEQDLTTGPLLMRPLLGEG